MPTSPVPARTLASTARGRCLGAAAALAAVLAAGACSGGGPGSGDFSVESLVAELPAGDDRVLVSVGDLDAATEAAGLERPTEGDAEEARQWFVDLTGGRTESGVFVPVPDLGMQRSSGQEDGEELGWGMTDVHTFAHTELPPQRTMLVTGDFDDDTLSDDLEDLGEGVYSAGSGEDFSQSLGEGTALRPTGAPLRLAREGNVIMVDAQEQAVRDWLQDADRDTFADEEEIMAVASALDDAGPYAATISSAGPIEFAGAVSGSQAEQLQDQLEQWAIREPFGVVALGWGMDDDQPTVRAVYHFGEQGAAERAVEQVESVWQDGVSMQSAMPLAEVLSVQDVTQDGPLVVATLHPEHAAGPTNAYQMLINREVTFGYLEP